MSKKAGGILPQVEKSKTTNWSRPPSPVTSRWHVAALTWEDYVYMLLLESGNVARAAIHRCRDGKALASTDDIALHKEQVMAIQRGYLDPTALRVEGLSLGPGLRFTLTRITDCRIMVGRDAASGHGCVLYKTNFCLLVAVYEDGNHPGGCYTLVTKLGDFLVDSGF